MRRERASGNKQQSGVNKNPPLRTACGCAVCRGSLHNGYIKLPAEHFKEDPAEPKRFRNFSSIPSIALISSSVNEKSKIWALASIRCSFFVDFGITEMFSGQTSAGRPVIRFSVIQGYFNEFRAIQISSACQGCICLNSNPLDWR